MFVDESKVRGYTMAAVACSQADASRARRELVALRMKGQTRLHFVRESDQRRRLILSTLARLGVQARLYRVEGLDVHRSRDLCLEGIVADVAALGVENIVLEADTTVIHHDLGTLQQAAFDAGVGAQLRYGHERAAAEPLLWAADAIVWSYTKGGDWLRRIAPMVRSTRLLLP